MIASPSSDLRAGLLDPYAGSCAIPGQRTPPRAGAGTLAVEQVAGASALVTSRASSPLQLLAPRPRGAAVWIVAASHGGGLVTGDSVALEVSIGAGATACVGTQAETKVYRAGAGAASQRVAATIAPGALLAWLPDPVSPFAGARYVQDQRFALAPGASLAVLDAVTAGRAARGERWAFDRFAARNEVRAGGALLLADAVRLAAGEGPPVARRLSGVELLATVILVGPRVAAGAAAIREAVGAAPAAADAPVLAAASPLADGVLLRVAGRSVEAGMAALRAHLAFLAGPLDGDPLLRRP
ncbi:MAG TPA: urease accessory protein UreD [Anaeromyxobacter sp.]|nr:urease accessory protein UreD [Anaeromyxobacter sp.]